MIFLVRAIAALVMLMIASYTTLSPAAALPALPKAQQTEKHSTAPFRLTTVRPLPPDRATTGASLMPRHPLHQRYSIMINDAARRTSLDPALVHAVIAVESGYNPDALSPKGAVGLMQVLPATASRYGVSDPGSSPEANLRAGTRYLSYLMGLFESRIELVLAAYNAGENAVLRYGHRIPPFRETQRYVPAVLARYTEWREPEPPVSNAPHSILYMPGTTLKPSALDALLYRFGGMPHQDRL